MKVWLLAVGDRASQRGGEHLRNEFFPSWLAANQDAAVEYGKNGAQNQQAHASGTLLGHP
jgi:hypothetical protein